MDFNNQKLIEFNNYLKGRKVAIIGLGVSNIPLLDYLHKLNARVTVFDRKQFDQMDQTVVDKVLNYGFKYSLGENYLDDLRGFEIIFRSPSCLPTVPEVLAESLKGAIVTTEIEMVMELAPCKVIGVTGSDGKTTTTTLISEILKEDGHKVWLGGNIGIPLFDKVGEMRPDDIVVLELSSFQLMNMKISPNISVITNIVPNHLDIHKDYEEYIDAKKTIMKYQSENDLVILNYDNEVTRSLAKEAKGRVIFFTSKNKIQNGYIVDTSDGKIKLSQKGLRKHIFDTRNMKLRGVHNFENAACAIAATKDLVKFESIEKVLTEFNGVEHRLEFVLETKNNVKWYNDSVSSSPTRTIAGLNSFALKNIILIAGGYDKNLDYSIIGKPIVDNCKALILYATTAPKIQKAVEDELKKTNKELPIINCKTLDETILEAMKISKKGDIVLFSPASTSFDMFKNFAERGTIFKEKVHKLVK